MYKKKNGSVGMDYKMLVMDMDGTLLTNDKRVTEKTKATLKKAADMGVKIVISTGRVFTSARLYSELLEMKTPIIASNGAYINYNDEVLYVKLFGEKNIRKTLELSKKYGLFPQFFTEDSIITEKLIYNSLNYTKWNANVPEDKRVKVRVIDPTEWDDVIEKEKGSILKAIVADEGLERLKPLRAQLAEEGMEVSSSHIYSGQFNIEIMDKGVTKASAVDFLANFYNMDKSQIICIGDSENDIPMIEYAGLGIAMGNGTEDAKKAANFITLSNEEDGVAYAVEKFILNSQK